MYGTSVKQLKKAKELIQKAIDEVEKAEFMRVHFETFGDFSLNFRITYRVESGNIHDYLDTQEEINLKIAESFEKEGLDMAFPTQTLYVHKED